MLKIKQNTLLGGTQDVKFLRVPDFIEEVKTEAFSNHPELQEVVFGAHPEFCVTAI